MNDELNDNHVVSGNLADKKQPNVCSKCNKKPCVCPTDSNKSHNPRTKPPKITWI